MDESFEYNTTVSVAAVGLVRKSYVQPLTVKWVRDHDDNGNLTNYSEFPVQLNPIDPPVFLTWVVEAPLDVGGTLQIDLKLAKVCRATFRAHSLLLMGTLILGLSECERLRLPNVR